ncbi:MAG: universal stress protein [Rhodospirillales bacterium]|nr:universal stress protein [Rhodospirillales bacterium]MDH3912195.1 universal stress protein [Rhodospirillales bacterium]MDH3917554.1 universal stress protein [Rhodospirillales bacterium]MDH3966954.1 universal stress protein [Rhodospirillales bacterium]
MAENIVLAAIDLQHDESDRNVAEEALALARNHEAELHLVFVVPDQNIGYVQAYIPAEMKAEVEKDARADLDAFGTSLGGGGTKIQTHVLRGIVYEEIVKLSDRIKADIVVIGAHKPGFMDFFLGPNSARVARHAECSVMIVRPGRNG